MTRPVSQQPKISYRVSKKMIFFASDFGWWEIHIEFFLTNPAVLPLDNVFQWTCNMPHVSDIYICPFWTTFLQDIIKLLSATRQGNKWSLFYFSKCPPPAPMHFTALSLKPALPSSSWQGQFSQPPLQCPNILACSLLRVAGQGLLGFEVAP